MTLHIKFRILGSEGYRFFDLSNVPAYVNTSNVEQYIGVKDEIGTCIYEGDIVAITFTGDDISHSLKLIKDIRFLPQLCGSSRECRVVGNIKENPELLK